MVIIGLRMIPASVTTAWRPPTTANVTRQCRFVHPDADAAVDATSGADVLDAFVIGVALRTIRTARR